MNGDRELIAMRRAGREPHTVWLTDSDDHYSRTTARDWHLHPDLSGRFYAHLRIEPNDIPEALDLRCCAGLECHLSTDRGAARFNRLFDALLDAGAAIVVGLSDGIVRHQKRTPKAP